MKYEIDKQTVEALIAYLITKPYSEVAGGIKALSELKEIKDEKNTTSDTEVVA
jgi:hypothetical protein